MASSSSGSPAQGVDGDRLIAVRRLVPRSGAEYRVLVMSGLTALLIIAVDQLSKIWAERFLQGQPPIRVIPGFFSLAFVTNKGAAWGIFNGHAPMLLVVALVVLAGAIWFFRKLTEGYTERYFALMIILGGVVGNAIDRLWRGEVVDFLDFVFGSYHFPTFNIADSAICCGVALYMLSSLLRRDPSGMKDGGKA
ncbi:MAG: signal peptidase II [Victivallaceae bacterium]|nr:signal peptidase II [Victivallaceae bacterium]